MEANKKERNEREVIKQLGEVCMTSLDEYLQQLYDSLVHHRFVLFHGGEIESPVPRSTTSRMFSTVPY